MGLAVLAAAAFVGSASCVMYPLFLALSGAPETPRAVLMNLTNGAIGAAVGFIFFVLHRLMARVKALEDAAERNEEFDRRDDEEGPRLAGRPDHRHYK